MQRARMLETPHDCRLSRLHPRLQAFITGPLRHYQNVEWRQNGVEPGRIIISRGGLIYRIIELDANPGDVQDLLHNHGILCHKEVPAMWAVSLSSIVAGGSLGPLHLLRQ